jgi:hypothetical protein
MASRRRAAHQPVSADEQEGTTEMTETDFATDEATEVEVELTYDQLKARVAELEAKLAEATKSKAKKDKPEKRKPDLPDGYISPVAFRHKLVELRLAGESMSPVQVYGLVRKASSNGMPVKHFDKAGNMYDEIQTHPVTNETLTRPGLVEEEALKWWKNRPKRQPGQPKAKPEGESADAAEDLDLEDAAAAEDLAADEDFDEAE